MNPKICLINGITKMTNAIKPTKVICNIAPELRFLVLDWVMFHCYYLPIFQYFNMS